jgi:hypothetical protein
LNYSVIRSAWLHLMEIRRKNSHFHVKTKPLLIPFVGQTRWHSR